MSPKPKILVVDDDNAIRTMLERVLTRQNFEVESACDGLEAIDKLRHDDYGAVLLDLMMPRLDGHGVLRYLERDRPTPPPVIIMTADLAGAESAAALDSVVQILPKPFDIGELIGHVRNSLRIEAPSTPPRAERAS